MLKTIFMHVSLSQLCNKKAENHCRGKDCAFFPTIFHASQLSCRHNHETILRNIMTTVMTFGGIKKIYDFPLDSFLKTISMLVGWILTKFRVKFYNQKEAVIEIEDVVNEGGKLVVVKRILFHWFLPTTCRSALAICR